ncbi:PREDICTED: uncharacterized protein LOC100637261 [Amphimedon queenslandica]|uniref:CTCK domain-containing protein n=1 Tax=Amphimedon queenslandica TaxID=400682 RepID=A0A1X7U4L0_AMPQE|nr:PREDICTED: uncharacterized protein LOC100637261 [Amphimedon queenslandica]|eukprot:XP_003389023.1 PREDICTED: uncharacterized protein LOC100637261 [Amphimedon queenslandica]
MKQALTLAIVLLVCPLVFSKSQEVFHPSCSWVTHKMTFYKEIQGHNCSSEPIDVFKCTGMCASNINPRVIDRKPPPDQTSYKHLFSQNCQCCQPDQDNYIQNKSILYYCVLPNGEKYSTPAMTMIANPTKCACQPC